MPSAVTDIKNLMSSLSLNNNIRLTTLISTSVIISDFMSDSIDPPSKKRI